MFYLALGILILTQGASFLLKPERRFFVIKLIFVGVIVLFLFFSLFQCWQQYQIWSQNEFSKAFLPPYQSWIYFLSYCLTNFFTNYLLSLDAALIFLIAAFLLNKKFQERFFEKEEPYLGALAIFLVGHPWWLYYIIIIGLIGVIGTLYLKIRRSEKRFPFYHFWLPVAIILMVVKIFLV